MIHVVAAEKRLKEDPTQAWGQPVGDFDTYAQALNAVGKWIDEGKDDETICFYFYEKGGISWTMIASLH
jgi:hypothetical protein